MLAKFRSLDRTLDNIREAVHGVDRKVTYVENVIRDHEEEDWCDEDHETDN